MAWYDEILSEGYVVRGSIEETTNSFPSTKVMRFDKYGNKVIDENGKQKYKMVKNIGDCYIQLQYKHKNDKIVCVTADVPYCRKHRFMMCGFSYGAMMNVFRDYFIENIGTINNISRLEKDNKGQEKRVWFNDKIVDAIKKNTPIDEIEELDGEIYAYSYDWKFLCELFRAKKVKGKAKDPFHESYLDWSSKYKIPENDLAEFKKIYSDSFGDDKLSGGKIIQELNNEFFRKHPKKLSIENKRILKIKDRKAFIHYNGYWSEYIKFLSDRLRG